MSQELNPKLVELFTKITSEKQMAQTIRRGAYLIALSFIRSTEENNYMDPSWTEDSFYHLNELAEALDPVLEEKNN